jgi:sulfate/thiosulfate transport system permease protein
MPASSSGTLALSPGAAQGLGSGGSTRARARPERAARTCRLAVRCLALGYLAVLLLAPLAMIFYRTFERGIAPVWNTITAPNFLHALVLSLEVVAIAVPLNTILGIGVALLLERGRMRGKTLLGLVIDLPFALSPVVIGLGLVLAYGNTGWLGKWLSAHGLQVIFSVPGIVIGTAIVSLPFVARETIPVLRELGTDAEQAASTLGASAWQTLWRITLPGIRWAVVYGVVLTTARALGEFGAVSIVSGRIEGKTQTLPLFVQDRFENFDLTGAYAAALVLALLALATLLVMGRLARRGEASESV